MTAGIDWARLAKEELTADSRTETTTPGGVVLPLYTTGGHLRAWIKFRGEPAFRLVETPAAFATRWMAFRDDPKQTVCVFHEHEFGQAIFLFREALDHLMYVQVTFPGTEQGRTTPGSIWAGECNCAKYGGPCPPRD